MSNPEDIPKEDIALLEQLREPTARLYEDHLKKSIARDWMPHTLVPFDEAKTFSESQPWRSEEYPLPDGVRSAIYVNLLTEDNLPYYTDTILGHAPRNHPLRDWTQRWTAEEARHSEVIREWAHATRAIDPVHLEIGRMAQMGSGIVPNPPNIAELLAYTSFQELATQVSHRNTSRHLDPEHGGKRVMATVAGDEGLHHEFYSELTKAALEISPSQVVVAIANQLRDFRMPGTGIPGFTKHALAIEKAGIYDTPQFLNLVVRPTLKRWELDRIDSLNQEGEEALKSIEIVIGALVHSIARREERIAKRRPPTDD